MAKQTTSPAGGTKDLIGELARRKRSDRSAYKRLVEATADGGEVSPEEAEQVLSAAGVSVEAFAADVAAVMLRREQDAFLATIPHLETAATAARAKLEARREEVRLANERLAGELRQLTQAVAEAETPLAVAREREREILRNRQARAKAQEDE